ncbi:hypothetical protein DL768_001281 [Monosporascus sp. mg162]|nr:hypothetical protein DL768_001281 [Monosporascus sp. mg162]
MGLFSRKKKQPLVETSSAAVESPSAAAITGAASQTDPQTGRKDSAKKSEAPRKFGLNQIFPDPSQPPQDTKQQIDSIVAIHGLSAESPRTWEAWKIDGDPKSGNVHWLKDADMLPKVIPNARIFTYDWNAGYEKGAATDILLGHADALLHRLHVERDAV